MGSNFNIAAGWCISCSSSDDNNLAPRCGERSGQQFTSVMTRSHPQRVAMWSCLNPTRKTLWRQDLIAESLIACDALLPVRFGTTFASEKSLRQMLHKNRLALAEGLIRVQGCVELGLRALWPSDELIGESGIRP